MTRQITSARNDGEYVRESTELPVELMHKEAWNM